MSDPTPLFRRVVQVDLGADQIVFSWHAVKRWRERVEPGLTIHRAVPALSSRTWLRGKVERRRPNGIDCLVLRHQLETVAWLIVDDAVFPLVLSGGEFVATTCIARRT